MKNASWTLCIVCWTFEVTRMHKDRQICCSATVMFPTLKPLVRPETSVKSAGSLNPVHFHVWLDNIITENIPVCIYTQTKRSDSSWADRIFSWTSWKELLWVLTR